MIRPLIFCFLLSVSAIVLGQPLYKWVEPDGSITFSVKPPPAGVTFEQVDANKLSADAKASLRDKTVSSTSPSIGEALPQTAQRQQVQIQRASPPLSGRASAKPGIYRSTAEAQSTQVSSNVSDSTSVAGSTESSAQNTSPSNAGRKAALQARNRKQRQCEDLQKRVVSLERRLRSRLTPDDMDNTVVHMARYQRSYDQHCVQ